MSPASALRLAQFEPQGRRGRRRLCPDALSGCGADGDSRTPFWRRTFDSCDLEIVTPSRAGDLLGQAGQDPIGPIGDRRG
jgi:hypothetical protein